MNGKERIQLQSPAWAVADGLAHTARKLSASIQEGKQFLRNETATQLIQIPKVFFGHFRGPVISKLDDKSIVAAVKISDGYGILEWGRFAVPAILTSFA